MQRYNSFNMIHKALRAMMYDTALTLQQTYFADAEEAETAIDKVETVIENFEQHAHHEDTFMLPAIGAFEPRLVDSFEKEHVKDIEIGNNLKTLVNIFHSLQTIEERVNCGSALNKSFRDFMVFNIEHMAKEEIEINRVLWQQYTDAELHELNGRLLATIPPAEMMVTAKWMLSSVNKNEATDWLKGVKKTAPSFVFNALHQMAETELPVQFRAEVLDAVMESEMVF